MLPFDDDDAGRVPDRQREVESVDARLFKTVREQYRSRVPRISTCAERRQGSVGGEKKLWGSGVRNVDSCQGTDDWLLLYQVVVG